MRTLITTIGQACRKCGTPVVKRTHKPNWKPKEKQPYYFMWWLKCLGCKNIYMVESAKVFTDYGRAELRAAEFQRNSDLDRELAARLERELPAK